MGDGQKHDIESIQALRGFAAMLVVFLHCLTPARRVFPEVPHWSFGASGVDIFFVLSGFIIFTSQARRPPDPLDFARRRFERVVPLYWLYTGLLYGMYALQKVDVDGSHLLLSLMLIPHQDPMHAGEIWPLLAPGWTLYYEMFFYALFAIAIAIRPTKIVAILVVAMLSLVVCGEFFGRHNSLTSVYTSSVLLEFIAGVLVAALAQKIPFPRILVWAAPVGVALLLLSELYTAPQVVVWGIPAILLLVACIAARSFSIPKPILILGDASYSIYLTHYITLKFLGRNVLLPTASSALYVFALMVICAVVGLWCYYAIERPLMRRFNARRKRKSHGAPREATT